MNGSKLAASPVDKRSWPNASAERFTTMEIAKMPPRFSASALALSQLSMIRASRPMAMPWTNRRTAHGSTSIQRTWPRAIIVDTAAKAAKAQM